MKKFMYWLWGVAEDLEFSDAFPRPFWSWLVRVCDRYHGYRHNADGLIVTDRAPDNVQGGPAP